MCLSSLQATQTFWDMMRKRGMYFSASQLVTQPQHVGDGQTVCQPRQTETAGINSPTGYQKGPWSQHASNCPLTEDGQCFGDTPVVSPTVPKPLVGHSTGKYLPESTTRTWCWQAAARASSLHTPSLARCLLIYLRHT